MKKTLALPHPAIAVANVWSRLAMRRAAWRAFLLSVVAAGMAFAQNGSGATAGGTNDPTAIIKGGVCGTGGLLGFVTNPIFIGVALAAAIAIYGWNSYFGQMDAAIALRRGFVGLVLVLCCGTIAAAFVSGCA